MSRWGGRESALNRRISAAARGSRMRPVLISLAWIWCKSRMVLHVLSSGKKVEGCGEEMVGL